ncbi:MAG: hypothetical protein IMW94_01855 [Thermoanaerobacter sp.]|nr:hypothetical protein [Thermoanaerobacter sp.]
MAGPPSFDEDALYGCAQEYPAAMRLDHVCQHVGKGLGATHRVVAALFWGMTYDVTRARIVIPSGDTR